MMKCKNLAVQFILNVNVFLPRMSREVTAPHTVVEIEVTEMRPIRNGVIHSIKIHITELATQRTFSLAEEMIKNRMGVPSGESKLLLLLLYVKLSSP